MVLGFPATQQGAEKARDFATAAVRHGVLVHLSGIAGERVALIPPLTVTVPELQLAVDRLLEALVSCGAAKFKAVGL